MDSNRELIDCEHESESSSEIEKKLRLSISPWLQYLYFLRFPILGWFSLLLLCFLDAATGLSALTRGIMTMDGGWQLFHATFFSIALLMAVLICAKNIVRNGPERFKSIPPEWLSQVLKSGEPITMWLVLGVAQFPSVITLAYIGYRTVSEQTGWARNLKDKDVLLETIWPRGGWHWRLYLAYLLGLFASAIFWYLVSVFYYWTYPAPPAAGEDRKQSEAAYRPAKPLLFPLTAFRRGATEGKNYPGSDVRSQDTKPTLVGEAILSEKPWFAQWIESFASKVLRVTNLGYSRTKAGPLYELHFLSVVSLGAVVLLYFFLYPLVAPVIVRRGFGLDTLLALLIFIAFAVGSATWKHRRIEKVGRLFTLVIFIGVIVFYGFYFVDSKLNRVLMETAFPTFGSILVILIFLQWLFAGASFFMDRYRIPVLSAVLLLILGPKIFPGIDQEHYFDAITTNKLDPSQVDSPAQAIEDRSSVGSDKPFVIVTAMGGGIQAAEWTAQIMSKLETSFRNDPELGYTLHDRLLLASGVSGGSVGLMPYLLEYTAPVGHRFETGKGKDGRDLLTARLTGAPGCTGLEAVGWGLEYYDLQRLLLTARFSWLQITDKGAAPDRTWALTKAMNRNLNDRDCGTENFSPLADVSDGENMTLVKAAELLQQRSMPAFTFNTTVAETGDRFLLSNYRIPPNPRSLPLPPSGLIRGTAFLPAESFLHAYTMEDCCHQSEGGRELHADVSLATAARLSATFPVVSSGTRIPERYADIASHFLDGGYFDNDGTASVIEFLSAAMEERRTSGVGRPLRILLVEIRDGEDMNPGVNDDDFSHQTGRAKDLRDRNPPKPWSTFSQIVAPLLGMWNAGHTSTTRRNRRELCLLERGYQNQGLEIHHVVFGIPNEVGKPATATKPPTYKASPLSWKLTEGQKQYIVHWANDERATNESLSDALDWLKGNSRGPAPCSVEDQILR